MVMLEPLACSKEDQDSQGPGHGSLSTSSSSQQHNQGDIPQQQTSAAVAAAALSPSHTLTPPAHLTPPTHPAPASASSTSASDSHPLPLPATPLYGNAAQPGIPADAADIKPQPSRLVAAAATPSSGPNVSQRPSTTPSLLSRALATARGIPSKQQVPTDKQRYAAQSSTVASDPLKDNGAPSDTTTTTTTATATTTTNPNQVSTHRNDEKLAQHDNPVSLLTTHKTSNDTAAAMAAPAVPSRVAQPFTSRDVMPGAASFSDQTIAHIRESLMEHREFLDRTRGRTSSSLEIDRKTFELPFDHPFSYSTSPDDLDTATSTYYFDRTTTSPSKLRDSTAPDQRQYGRHGAFDHRAANGTEKTEKIWSIGAGEGSEEDGLVEKSVAEAMAGVEPNTRSRKASYSLRFFKEALPNEEKPRRKDTKTPREKLIPTLEEQEPTASVASKGAEVVVVPSDNEQAPQPQPLQQTEEKTLQKTSHTSETIENVNTEQDDVAGDETPVARPADHDQPDTSSLPPLDVGPIPASVTAPKDLPSPATPKGRDSCDSGDPDAEESGEEKISSAVFVPHQELADDPRDEVESPSPDDNLRPRTQSHSQPHPWLVKADEPEPEIAEQDEKPYELSHRRSRENLAPRRVEQEAVQADPRPIEVDIEPKTIKHSSRPRIITPHEEHIHDHTHNHTREPLEAIELIPYKHQVGGHTTLWRFSRRAVCKQLNNRENEFYETIERYHRDLLPFLPRLV